MEDSSCDEAESTQYAMQELGWLRLSFRKILKAHLHLVKIFRKKQNRENKLLTNRQTSQNENVVITMIPEWSFSRGTAHYCVKDDGTFFFWGGGAD